MLLHISTRRNIALDLVARGLVTQTEAATLIGESKQALAYQTRDIDTKAARLKYLADLWQTETMKRSKAKSRQSTRVRRRR